MSKNTEVSKIEEENSTNQSEFNVEEKQERKLSRDELKAKYRRVAMEYSGRLTIDDKYKVPGKVLRIDRGDLATRKNLEMLGYTPVRDRNVQVGTGSLSEANSRLGSEVSVEMGIVHSDPGILYECDQEVYDVRKEIEAEANTAQLENTISDAQFEELKARTKLGSR